MDRSVHAVARSQRVPPADERAERIAYDKATRRIFITGKKWPRLYQITVGARDFSPARQY